MIKRLQEERGLAMITGLMIAMVVLISAAIGLVVGRWMTQR